MVFFLRADPPKTRESIVVTKPFFAKFCLSRGLMMLGVFVAVSCSETPSTARRPVKKIKVDGALKKDTTPLPQNELDDHAANGDSVAVFQRKTFPLLVTWCGGCHGSVNAPYFSQPDVKKAHDDLLQSSKVDLKNPENSRIYIKLAKEQHNCPTARCEESGAELLSAIKQWARDVGGSVDKFGESRKTAALTLIKAPIIPSPTPENPANPPASQDMRMLTYDLAPLSGIAGAQLIVEVGL
jgi:hypothetical protein